MSTAAHCKGKQWIPFKTRRDPLSMQYIIIVLISHSQGRAVYRTTACSPKNQLNPFRLQGNFVFNLSCNIAWCFTTLYFYLALVLWSALKRLDSFTDLSSGFATCDKSCCPKFLTHRYQTWLLDCYFIYPESVTRSCKRRSDARTNTKVCAAY